MVRALGWQTRDAQRKRACEQRKRFGGATGIGSGSISAPGSQHHCWDPKGGELCLTRAKPEETLVEARSRSDVQIDGQSWV